MDASDNLEVDLLNGKNPDKSADAATRDFSGEPILPPDSLHTVGKCIILNYEEYEKKMKLNPRKESKLDAESLVHVFTQLKFDVETHLNLSKSGTLKILEKASLNVPKESKYFVCCMLTHGDKMDRLAVRNGKLELNDLLKHFYTCKNLIGKPKIFIIQACRGDVGEKEVKMESTDLADLEDELHPDFIIAYATYPGTVSFKNSQYGSLFIQELCNCFEHYSNDQDLLQILTVVNYHISNFFKSCCSERTEIDKSRQMPNFTSTLQSPILFQMSIKPNKSGYRKIHDKRRAKHRLDQSGEIDPNLDLKSYSIPSPQNVKFFQILIKKGGPKELLEAEADLNVYIKEKKYQQDKACCNLNKSVIMEKLASFAKADHAAINCVICFIVTSTKYGLLRDKRGRKFSKQEAIEAFIQNQHCSLVGKPKIFIFLICESKIKRESCDDDDAIEKPDSYFTAQHADILDITISIKNENHLIGPMREFTRQLKMYGRSEDFLTILTRINSTLINTSKDYKFQIAGGSRNTFIFNSALTKKLYLP